MMVEKMVEKRTKDDFLLINVYEDIVKESILEMLPYMEMCTCPKCISDACAMVLNQLKPHYVTTRKGELFSQIPQMKTENQVDIAVMVVKALRQVKESPQH